MAKPELGLKRTCVDCNARFYDLNRIPPVCPKCGTTQPSHLSRLKQHDEDLPDEKEKELNQNEHDSDVDIDTPDGDDDVISPDDDLDDDDISNDIEVTTDKDDNDDS